MIKTLTSWRGIFALCIVCFHFAMHEFDQMTYAGVTFFFMLSGFLVTYKHETLNSVKSFYSRRLWRIFPLHWLVLVAMILLDLAVIHRFHYGWDLPLHVTLLQSWIPYKSIHYNYSIHSWFLSSLMFCVLATPLLLKVIKKLRLKMVLVLALVACAIVIVLNTVPLGFDTSYCYVCPLTRLVDYALGMVLGVVVRKLQAVATRQYSLAKASFVELCVLMALTSCVAIHASGNFIAVKLENSPLWWIPVAAIIFASAMLNGQEGVVGKVLKLRPLVWLGEISFEVYLLQKLVNNAFCYLVAPLFGHYGIMIYDYSFACTLPLLIVTAWAVNRLLSFTIAKRLAPRP